MNNKKAVAITLLVMLLWGLLFPLVKMGYAAYSVKSTADILLFAGIRFTLCGIAITALAFIKDKNSLKALKTEWERVAVIGILAVGLHYGLSYVALSSTDSSKTAIIKQIGSILYVCLSGLFFKNDKFSAKKLIGAFLGFSGIVVMNINKNKLSVNFGDVLILASSLCMVVSNIISKRTLENVSPLAVTGVSQLLGGALLILPGIAGNGRVNIGLNSDALILIITVAASSVAYCLWYTMVKRAKLSNLFIIKFAEPVFASVFGMLLLGEDILNLSYLGGFLLISLGIIIVNIKLKRE